MAHFGFDSSETLPVPLDGLGDPSGLDEFRISSPREIASMLRQLNDGNITLNLYSADGASVKATIWTLDSERGTLGFSVDVDSPGMDSIVGCQEVVVVGYLDSVKVQFDALNVMLVRGRSSAVLNCAYPRELFRFQRRGAFRVQPAHRSAPVAKLRHSQIADMRLALRVLDVSIGGCALFLPDDVPAMQPGNVMNQVLIELDLDTHFHVNLRLQHVTSLNADQGGVRLGCEFVGADASTLRQLQRYIDQTQKRSRLLTL